MKFEVISSLIFYTYARRDGMAEGKKEDKDLKGDIEDGEDPVLDGKGLHDLYRHATKLIK